MLNEEPFFKVNATDTEVYVLWENRQASQIGRVFDKDLASDWDALYALLAPSFTDAAPGWTDDIQVNLTTLRRFEVYTNDTGPYFMKFYVAANDTIYEDVGVYEHADLINANTKVVVQHLNFTNTTFETADILNLVAAGPHVFDSDLG